MFVRGNRQILILKESDQSLNVLLLVRDLESLEPGLKAIVQEHHATQAEIAEHEGIWSAFER